MTLRSAFVPVGIDLDRSTRLRIDWDDGHKSEYPLSDLRRACPCAVCRAEREERNKTQLVVITPRPVADMVTVRTAELVGNYAIRLVWNDGHDTGIYDYRLLRSVCPCTECKKANANGRQ